MADQPTSGADISRYPMHRMVAVLDDPADTRAALDELTALGVDSSDVLVLTGEEGVARSTRVARATACAGDCSACCS